MNLCVGCGRQRVHTKLCLGTLGKCQLGRPSRDREDKIKMDLLDVHFEDGRWVEPAEDHFQLLTLLSPVFSLQVLLPILIVIYESVLKLVSSNCFTASNVHRNMFPYFKNLI
jgi:hypothetical protein